MESIIFPEKENWESLCKRPGIDRSDLTDIVISITNRVKSEGDKAIWDYSEKFDGMTQGNLQVSSAEIEESSGLIPQELKNAINTAKKNIEKFHSSQLTKEPVIETMKGVRCWRKSLAPRPVPKRK